MNKNCVAEGTCINVFSILWLACLKDYSKYSSFSYCLNPLFINLLLILIFFIVFGRENVTTTANSIFAGIKIKNKSKQKKMFCFLQQRREEKKNENKKPED